MATPEQPEQVTTPEAEVPETPTETQRERIERLQREWEAEGHSAEEIGKRLARLAEESEAEAETPTDEPEPTPEAEQPTGPPDASWPLCPVCKGNGHVPPGLQHARDKRMCPECHGHGMVLTGSLTEEKAVQQCTSCMGDGYEQRPRDFEQTTGEPPAPSRNW